MTLFPAAPSVVRSATLSPDGVHRYRLERRWSGGGALLWVMLNPSTADAETDDPTIRRVVAFTTREGHGTAIVCNLHSVRATDPADLRDLADYADCYGDQYLSTAVLQADRVVVAWGAHAARWPRRVAHVRKLLAATGRPLLCFGTTSAGHPRHPLYLAAATPLVDWRPRG